MQPSKAASTPACHHLHHCHLLATSLPLPPPHPSLTSLSSLGLVETWKYELTRSSSSRRHSSALTR